MVFKSAYQRSFGRSKWDGFTMEEFQRKLQYRTDRRSVEHQHQAWLWDSDDEEEDVEEIPIDQGDKVNKHVTKKQTKPNDNERKKSVLAWVNEQQDVVGEEKRVGYEEKDTKESGQKNIEHRDLQSRNDALNEAELHERRHRESDHKHKHRSVGRKPRFQKKDKTPVAVSPSRVHDLDEKKRHPPFLPYGWANDAPTEWRKTHNVLASDREVYPAALRASKRRQNAIDYKVKLHEEAIKNKELIAPLAEEANALFPEEMWLTEYQRNFCKADDLKRHFGR